MWFSLSLQAGDGGRGVLLWERSGFALSGVFGLKHAGDLGAEKVMTDSSSRANQASSSRLPSRWPAPPLNLRRKWGQWVNRLRTRGLFVFNTSLTLESSSSTSRSRRRLLPQWGRTFQGLERHLWCRNVDTNRTCPGGTDMLFFCGDQIRISLCGWPIAAGNCGGYVFCSSSVPPSAPSLQGNYPLVCNSVLLLFYYYCWII